MPNKRAPRIGIPDELTAELLKRPKRQKIPHSEREPEAFMRFVSEQRNRHEHGLMLLRESLTPENNHPSVWKRVALELAIWYVPYFAGPGASIGRKRLWNAATNAYLLNSISVIRQETETADAAYEQLATVIGNGISRQSLKVQVAKAKRDPGLVTLVESFKQFPFTFRSSDSEGEWRSLVVRGKKLLLLRHARR
jgi:hypothetical protein